MEGKLMCDGEVGLVVQLSCACAPALIQGAPISGKVKADGFLWDSRARFPCWCPVDMPRESKFKFAVVVFAMFTCDFTAMSVLYVPFERSHAASCQLSWAFLPELGVVRA